MDRYDPQAIEAKWQAEWEREGAFVVPNPSPDDAPREHTYVLEMLPYPSGELHMGHVLNYTLGDVVAHIRRRRGFTVLRPIGYDAFGLPAENAAIREGKHPRDVTNRNIAAIREQMKRLGWSIDWSRELSTAEPDYYHWTQWLFLKFFEAGLAYRKGAIVNWCPNDQTVLANEQVIDGHCERCGWEVEARTLEQWFFRITAYADRLLDDMAMLESWPERVLTMQRNWIGRSEGAEVVFRIEELDIDIPVFTTRPDTLFGATFFVLAPEHALVERLVKGTPHEQEVMDYVRHAAGRPVAERADPEKEKTGVSTGRFVTNPVNDNRLPIWVSDYVLMEYGTGAIMAVPAHDERDYAFAKRFELPIKTVIAPADGEVPEDEAFVPHSDDEVLVDSAQFSAMTSPEAKKAIVTWLESRERGQAGGQLPAARLAALPPALLGLPDPDSLLRRVRSRARARGRPARAPPRGRGVRAEGALAACRRRGLGGDDLPEVRWPGPARDRHHGHLRRLLLVLPPLLRPQKRRGAVRPRHGRLLAARQPVHRRDRARDPAPPLRALLHEGHVRPRHRRLPGAVRAALQPGDAPLPRREDVQVEGERRRP